MRGSILWALLVKSDDTLVDSPIPHSIPGYHIKAALGEGGMANVFLATQTSLDRPVAIKILNATLNQDPGIQEQFAQESRIIAQLNHPNIIQVIDQGNTEQGLPYFVMTYIKAITLDTILQRDDVSLTRKLDIFIQICSALAYAHRNGIIHRDIKPANVLVDYDGHVRLVDFGIAGYFTAKQKGAAPAVAMVMGTDAYMAPEQRLGSHHTSQLSDIYALGVLMHEVVFGVLPAEATAETYSKPLQDKYQLAPRLRSLIEQCLADSPKERPVSAEALRQTLLLLAQGRHLRTNRWSMESTRDNMPPNYTLLDVLKENPFGATYLVNDPNRQRLLVIKKQHLEHLGNAPVYAAKLTHIQHPHLVRILGTGKNPRVFILASEYMAGGSLQDRLSHTLNLGQWLQLAQQLCNALACAHSYGLVHGNLRPSNLLFTDSQQLKLSDFGFPAHSYGDDRHWYHPAGEPSSTSTDIYAAGAILFQILTGKPPSSRWCGLSNRWALRSLSGPLRRLLQQMIASNPRQRLASAELAARTFTQLQATQHTRVLQSTLSH